jgi:hypothetical protein
MRSSITVAKLFLAGAVALGALSCGAKTKPEQDGNAQGAEAQPVEDSGKRLAGEFALFSLENAYASNKSQVPPATVFTFDEAGIYKRQDRSRVEEGVYLVGTRNELVIYVEKINGELLPAARVDRYLIVEQSDDAISLESGPSRKLVLKKRK